MRSRDIAGKVVVGATQHWVEDVNGNQVQYVDRITFDDGSRVRFQTIEIPGDAHMVIATYIPPPQRRAGIGGINQ